MKELNMTVRFNSLLLTVLSRIPNLFTSRGMYTKVDNKPELGERNWTARLRGRSIFIRHLDTGSSNGSELSINAINNPRYDIERLGFHFVASPRHADMLLVTGPMTYNMIRAAEATFDAMPDHPRYVVTVGDDTEGGGIFRDAYGVLGHLPRVYMQTASFGYHIGGPVPRPDEILTQLCSIVDKQSGNQIQLSRSIDHSQANHTQNQPPSNTELD
jgi:Ni,Fe-hydrogenase III small subunit